MSPQDIADALAGNLLTQIGQGSHDSIVTHAASRSAEPDSDSSSLRNSTARRNAEQDHRFIKKRIAASLWFRSVDGALNTMAGYEAMHMIRKGQIRWLPKGDTVGQVQFVNHIFGLAL